MTKLFIEGVEVALATDYEIDYYVNNPFFTKNGEFTYDLDINLKHPGNEKLYEFIHRKDVHKTISNRKALLVCGPRQIIRGTEVILSVEDSIVKIQIVGGNSELNYLSAGQKTLRELDLGIIPELTKNIAVNTLDKIYPETNFVCCPVIKEKGVFDLSGTVSKTDVIYNELNWDTRNGCTYKNDTLLVPQPFLLYYVEKVIEALGYNLIENILLDSERLDNGLNTREMKNILPKWTVDEFLTEIEKLFNVLFFVDSNGSNVHIVSTVDYYKSSKEIVIGDGQLLDSVEKQYGKEESLYVTYDNVSFKLPSGRWYRYQDIDDEILDKRTIVEVNTFDDIVSTTHESWLDNVIYDKSTGLYFVYSRENGSQGTATYGTLVPINAFKGIENDNSSNSCELNIIPSEIYGNNIYLSGADFGGSKYYDGWIAAATPVIANVVSVETQDRLFQEIENGVTEDETTDSSLFVALYMGMKPYLYSSYWSNQEIPQPGLDKITIPQCIVIPYFVHYRAANNHPKLAKIADEKFTLAIQGENGLYNTMYKDTIKVSTHDEYILKFLSMQRIDDAKRTFIIANKKYYCRELHYTISSNGLGDIVEGTFFPM